VATASDLTGEPAALLGLADRLLYVAKRAGRNRQASRRLEEPRRQARAA
jgi:PleD family two-component response regulator